MKKSPHEIKDEKELRVRRGRVESVDLYEIKDGELDLLERGSPADLQLNFAIFLFSTAFASLASLLTATFPNEVSRTFFIVITVVGIFSGAYLLLAWYRNRTSLKSICKRIRERIPPDVAAEVTTVEEHVEELTVVEQHNKPKG